jgi:methionine--tRNA ligase beta chain
MGSRRVGIALSDESGAMAFPHGVLPVTSGLAGTIAALVKEKAVGMIVIGESRDLFGTENPIAARARELGDALAALTDVPVHYEPELYTTQEAMRMPDGSMGEKGTSIDASAAAIILSRFLEKKKGLDARELAAAPAESRIGIDEFAKVSIKVGRVVSAERVENADKLLRLMVDLGEAEPRQIVSGIAAYVPEPQMLVGRQLSFVTNLEPRTIRGLESNGMLFAVGEGDSFAFMVPDRTVPPGTGGH